MRNATFVIIIAVLTLLGSAAGSVAAKTERLNFGKELNAAACGGGKLVVNVHQEVVNSVDSGIFGGNWAFVDYNRHIQVWQTAEQTFCAVLHYQGQFVTSAGPSPGNTGTVPDGLTGSFQGGIRTVQFTGVLLDEPLAASRGNIGTFDYGCPIVGDCPGFVDWTTLYFASTGGFDLDWWGFVYHAGNNGSWVNSIDGNSGDITG